MKQAKKETGEENLMTKTTLWAMELIGHYAGKGDTVVDATMGNGWDTVALAGLVGQEGRVFAFDIQPQALRATEKRLKEAGLLSGVKLILDTNANMGVYVKEAAAVLFNLGYLPGSDKKITTTREETLRAMKEALCILKPGGLAAAVLYSGHSRGAEEKDGLLQWAKGLSPREFHVAYISMWNQPKHPPELLLITKKKL